MGGFTTNGRCAYYQFGTVQWFCPMLGVLEYFLVSFLRSFSFTSRWISMKLYGRLHYQLEMCILSAWHDPMILPYVASTWIYFSFGSTQFLINYLTDFNEILETFLETPIRGMKTEVCCLQKKKLNFTGNFFNCQNIFFNWKDFQRKPICAFEKICPLIQFLIKP